MDGEGGLQRARPTDPTKRAERIEGSVAEERGPTGVPPSGGTPLGEPSGVGTPLVDPSWGSPQASFPAHTQRAGASNPLVLVPARPVRASTQKKTRPGRARVPRRRPLPVLHPTPRSSSPT